LGQCIKEEHHEEQMEVDNNSEHSISYKKLHGKIYEISHRVGSFLPKNEGNIFETNQAVNVFANVALSILPMDMKHPNIEDFNKHMLDNWSLLFDFLSVQNQTLLEIMARNYAKNLGECTRLVKMYFQVALSMPRNS